MYLSEVISADWTGTSFTPSTTGPLFVSMAKTPAWLWWSLTAMYLEGVCYPEVRAAAETYSDLGHVYFRQSYFLPQQKYCTKSSVTGLRFCSISIDFSCSKGCSKSACTLRSRISSKACAIRWIPFQFSLTCCDIQYKGVLVNFHVNTDDMLVPA